MLTTIIGIWAVFAVILIALSIHRSIFVMREQDIIFISPQERTSSAEYSKVFEQLKRLEVVLKVFSFSTGALMIVIFALWIYTKLYG